MNVTIEDKFIPRKEYSVEEIPISVRALGEAGLIQSSSGYFIVSFETSQRLVFASDNTRLWLVPISEIRFENWFKSNDYSKVRTDKITSSYDLDDLIRPISLDRTRMSWCFHKWSGHAGLPSNSTQFQCSICCWSRWLFGNIWWRICGHLWPRRRLQWKWSSRTVTNHSHSWDKINFTCRINFFSNMRHQWCCLQPNKVTIS